MTQLTVHATDDEMGRPVPAYSVCVARGRIFVRAFQPEWADTASRLEVVLNARHAGQPAQARAAEQEVPRTR
jgi:hypothetical protein